SAAPGTGQGSRRRRTWRHPHKLDATCQFQSSDRTPLGPVTRRIRWISRSERDRGHAGTRFADSAATAAPYGRHMHFHRLSAAVVLAAALATMSQPAVASPPPGYTIVHSGDLTSAANTVTRAVIDCPPGLVPFGGGVSNPLFGPQSVNSSLPTET